LEENAYLILGCYGRTENGFILCPSTENRILKLDDSLVNFEKIMDYFDTIKLFDRPIIDQNSIRHLIYNLQDRFDQKIKRLWTDHEYNLLERFLQMHKPCGFYAKLILVPEEFDKQIPIKDNNQVLFMKSIYPDTKIGKTTFNSNVIRGSRNI
jgi:hypothetical protein